MSKTRVYELAKEIKQSSKVIIDKAHALGIDVKNHMTTLSEENETKLRQAFQHGKSTNVTSTHSKQTQQIKNSKGNEPAKNQTKTTNSRKEEGKQNQKQNMKKPTQTNQNNPNQKPGNKNQRNKPPYNKFNKKGKKDRKSVV